MKMERKYQEKAWKVLADVSGGVVMENVRIVEPFPYLDVSQQMSLFQSNGNNRFGFWKHPFPRAPAEVEMSPTSLGDKIGHQVSLYSLIVVKNISLSRPNTR
jgi:hypothetical protein